MDWETQIKLKANESWARIKRRDFQNFTWNNISYNYRAEHTDLVFSIGVKMGKQLRADMDVLKAATLLHDIGHSVANKGHGQLGAQIAGEILENTDFPKNKIDQVKYAIEVHVGYNGSKPNTLEACIVWDADKLSKLGASIILQKSMMLPFRGKTSWDAVFEFNKLLKLAEFIKNNMKTELGLKMAEERFQIVKIFVTALNNDFTGSYFENKNTFMISI